jgi:LuxR family maltose regulon positive regulatory protein
MMSPLLSTKLYIPPARTNGVRRPRLTDRLLEGLRRPGTVALLSCPAGFGKTTLLSEFVPKMGKPVAWLSLDDGDNDPARFWAYVIAALQTVQNGLGDAALSLLQMPGALPDQAILTLLINELNVPGGDLTVVLDDYHLIQNQEIHAALYFLLDHLPERLHLVFSTRIDPPWPLARFRARNQLIELRAGDLRFSTEEIRQFLEESMGLSVSLQDSSALGSRTEGWIASLQLAALSMQGRSDLHAFIRDFTGSNTYVAEYLVEEVLQRQLAEVQDFLLKTSVLERLHPALCEAVAGVPDGDAMLHALQRANLFLVPLDDIGQWFRYHHLFADLLQARLRQSLGGDEIARLHQRAAAWYERAGMPDEAIQQAFAARDYSSATRLVERAALPLILQAHVRTVEAWLQAIPPEYLAESARANMALAWMHLLRANPDQAAPSLERLEVLFSRLPAERQDPSLLSEWLALRSKLSTMQGKPAEARELSERALKILPEQDAAVRSMLYVNLATAYQQVLDYGRAAGIFELIVRDARAAGNVFVEILGISGRGQMLLQQGKLHAACEAAMEGVSRLKATGRVTPFSATLYGELGNIHYHWHRLEEARGYFQQSIQASGLSGFSDPEIFHHVVLSRIAQMEGDWPAAAREMERAAELTHAYAPAMVREQVVSQQVRVDLALGHEEAARRQLEREGFNLEGDLHFPGLQPGSIITHQAGLLHNSALRILLFEAQAKREPARLRRGIELADLVLKGELQCQHLGIALETLLLRAQMQSAAGNEPAMLADVARAVELAEPEGYISVFVEEGEPIARGLRALLDHGPMERPRLAYIQEILGSFPVQLASPGKPTHASRMEADDSLVEPLSPREVEVLRLIAAGHSNQVIADRLVITLSAVKKHTGNIYRKLNVDSRTQAIVRARELGVLRASA